MKKQTLAVFTPYVRRDAYDALSMPVYNAVAYEFDDARTMADAFTNRITAPDYSRVENPTVTNFEQRVKALTGAAHVTAFNSGMAAISAMLMAVSAKGRSIVTSRHLFGNTMSLITCTLNRFGVRPVLCDLTDPQAVAEAVTDEACCIFFEIVTNPQLEVTDISALSQIARSKGVPLIADSTAIPFTQHDLSSLGVDYEIVSSTKYISGGGTSLGGLIIDYGRFEAVNDAVKREILFNLGAYMTPQVAYMQTLGLETLDARYRVQAGNALCLAQMMQEKLGDRLKVNYIGLEDNQYYALARRQFGPTAGAMMTIDLASREACFDFLDALKLVHRATNLFDNRTLAIHPASTIFGNFSEEEVAKMDVRQTTIRLSIGLEDPQDIFEDIRQALEKVR